MGRFLISALFGLALGGAVQAEQEGATIRNDAGAETLVRDDAGRVVGVRARQGNRLESHLRIALHRRFILLVHP